MVGSYSPREHRAIAEECRTYADNAKSRGWHYVHDLLEARAQLHEAHAQILEDANRHLKTATRLLT